MIILTAFFLEDPAYGMERIGWSKDRPIGGDPLNNSEEGNNPAEKLGSWYDEVSPLKLPTSSHSLFYR